MPGKRDHFRLRNGFSWLFALVLVLGVSQAAAAEDDWKYDLVHLKNGRALQGLVVRETPAEVLFQSVRRKPGAPTVVLLHTLSRDEIDFVEALDGPEREQLVARIKALDPTGVGEALRMRNLELKPAPWGKDGPNKALRYSSIHFVLVSNAQEELVRRSAVRLEQIYAAYARFLPPRHEAADATTVVLAQSLADYQALLKDQDRNLLNPAFYDGARNEIICAADLQKLGEALERSRQQTKQLLQEVEDQKTELNRLYKGKVPAEVLKRQEDARAKILEARDQNEKAFEQSFQEGTQRLMQRLYHEAFHAYLDNFVYPAAEGEVPRWLNEGLAQVFETALLDGDELRVGHADKDRLKRSQAALEKGDLVPLTDLLKSGPKQFLVLHATDKEESDRYYLTSWALAFYLTFDRRLLGTPRLDRYVMGLHEKADSLDAFRALVDEPLPQFEKEFRQFLQQLRPDGTVAKRKQG
jgi:hypothetical protein